MCQAPYISVFPEDDFGMKYWSSFNWNKTFSICYTNNALTSCILLVFSTWILPIRLEKQNPAIIQTLWGTLWKTCAAEWLHAMIGTGDEILSFIPQALSAPLVRGGWFKPPFPCFNVSNQGEARAWYIWQVLLWRHCGNVENNGQKAA